MNARFLTEYCKMMCVDPQSESYGKRIELPPKHIIFVQDTSEPWAGLTEKDREWLIVQIRNAVTDTVLDVLSVILKEGKEDAESILVGDDGTDDKIGAVPEVS